MNIVLLYDDVQICSDMFGWSIETDHCHPTDRNWPQQPIQATASATSTSVKSTDATTHVYEVCLYQ